MSRRSEGRREVLLTPPDGFERSDYIRDLRVDDLVQVASRKTWTTVTKIMSEWYILVRDRPKSVEKLVVRAKLLDGARRKGR